MSSNFAKHHREICIHWLALSKVTEKPMNNQIVRELRTRTQKEGLHTAHQDENQRREKKLRLANNSV